MAINPVQTASNNFTATNLPAHRGSATATAALAGDHAGSTGLHIVVRNVAIIRCLVPERVPINSCASGLA